MSAVEVLVEQALIDLLAVDAGVRAALGDPVRIRQGDAEMPAYPFLEIREHESRPADAAGFEGSEHTIDLLIASQNDKGQGSLEGLAAVRLALSDAELVMEGWRSVLVNAVFADVLRGGAGVWRAILRVRIVLEEA